MKTRLKKGLMIAMLSGIAITAYAEDAPVFDADSYPPAFDDQSDSSNVQAQGVVAANPPRAAEQPVIEDTAEAPNAYAAASSNLTPQQRMAKVEQQINNLQHLDPASKIAALQSELQALRGEVENLTHQLQQMQTQQKAMYSDLDKRLAKQPQGDSLESAGSLVPEEPKSVAKAKPIPTPAPTKAKPKPAAALPNTDDLAASTLVPATAAPTPPTQAKAVTPQPNVAEEQALYQTAYDLIKAKKYNEAVASLQGMLKKYPTGQSAANAHYWLGELYGLLGKNEQSAQEFGTIVKQYPDSPKVSDAQLKLGLIYAAQFKWIDAKAAFKYVIGHYPGTASSRLAAEQLKAIKLAGH